MCWTSTLIDTGTECFCSELYALFSFNVNVDFLFVFFVRSGPSEAKRRRKLLSWADYKGDAKSPAEVPPPQLNEVSPPTFVAPDGWLDDLCEEVKAQFHRKDTEYPRVSPVALVRFSRGGKTRALHELASALRGNCDDTVAIIYISFNGQTELLPWEKDKPLQALCRRVLFTALGEKDARGFHTFAESSEFRKEDVTEWLGNANCILLIDELNLVQTAMDDNFASFVKRTFMEDIGKALVFSSHVISVNNVLTSFMQSASERSVITKKLPLAQNLVQAKNLLDMPSLTPQMALYLGLVPALFYCSKLNQLPHQRREHAIKKYIDSGITVEKVKKLLGTLLTGNHAVVPEMLLELMDIDVTIEDGVKRPIARWIPYHMKVVLDTISQLNELPDAIRCCLAVICRQFGTFRSQKLESGDGWEALFIVTLLVRCMTRSFCTLVPLHGNSGEVCWNSPFTHDNFGCTTVEEFVNGIPFRHDRSISVYYPSHSNFEAYDVILACWGDDGTRKLYGYQLNWSMTDFAILYIQRYNKKLF